MTCRAACKLEGIVQNSRLACDRPRRKYATDYSMYYLVLGLWTTSRGLSMNSFFIISKKHFILCLLIAICPTFSDVNIVYGLVPVNFRSFTKSYFRKADAVVVTYDCMHEKSFLHLRSWLFDVEDGTNGDIVLLFLANKQDLVLLESDRTQIVSNDEGKRLAKASHFMACFAPSFYRALRSLSKNSPLLGEYNGHFYPVSAKTSENLREAFLTLARHRLIILELRSQ
ncbi:unnamed protein product [Protopolystoma xenopodis]|uniref:Uncharacterized protein n=1 Tax=Protopolystoma xenopodis TaxID=117903 RepID=A0A448XD60_9PLAT|nr:unnamed protein product [Protopolystoma xenopodis]